MIDVLFAQRCIDFFPEKKADELLRSPGLVDRSSVNICCGLPGAIICTADNSGLALHLHKAEGAGQSSGKIMEELETKW